MEPDQAIKARQVILRLSASDRLRLKKTQHEAARCWNDILSIGKAYYTAGNGWIPKGDLQKTLKGSYRLQSQTIQGLTDRFCANRLTAAKNGRQGLATRYPWREKKFVTIPFKQAAIKRSVNGILVLSLTAGDRIDTGVVIPERSTPVTFSGEREATSLAIPVNILIPSR
jgi:putative transposase